MLVATAIGFSGLYAAGPDVHWVAEATKVQVKILETQSNPAPFEVKTLTPPTNGMDTKDWKNSLPDQGATKPWFVINIPIEICATGTTPLYKGSKSKSETLPARYVNELTVTAYVLFKKSDKAIDKSKTSDGKGASPANYYLLKKEITYVNIPMGKNAKKDDGFKDLKEGGGYAKMNVGLFLSPAAVLKLSGYDETQETDPKCLNVAAVAIEPTFKGLPCRPIVKNSDSRLTAIALVSTVYDKDLRKKKAFSGEKKWWVGSEEFAKTDAELSCISETPFAPFYAAGYPATKPLYGSPSSAAKSTPAETTALGSDKAPTAPGDTAEVE